MMPKKDTNSELFGRRESKPSKADLAFRKRMQAVQALCENGDFREWLFDALDDLSGFARDEGMLTDFGQGIRAAAARLKNRLLIVKEGVDLLTELTHRNLEADHKGFVAAIKNNNN